MKKNEEHYVDASATKAFFIDMLVRDISLDDAVLDLLDNSVDAAKEYFDGNLSKARIDLVLDKDSFQLIDNCGGFSLERAKSYIFRFGRPSGSERYNSSNESIGQFGVGLKRAIFKLAKLAHIDSLTEDEAFRVQIDVDAWRDESTPWHFPYEEMHRVSSHLGTRVVIDELLQLARREFPTALFKEDLKRKIRRAHYSALSKGLVVTFNGEEIYPYNLQLIYSRKVRPVRKFIELGGDVTLDLCAGLGSSSPPEAGWYVFCNDRMVLSADQSNMTGWGEASLDMTAPRYHNQFARFRGIARFISPDARLLPWNTTKRGVDASHEQFVKGRGQMVGALKDVVKVLNDLDKELENPIESERELRNIVGDEESNLTPYLRIPIGSTLTFPKVPKKEKTDAILSCSVSKERIEALKVETNSRTNQELAQFCFDYTFDDFVGS